jgi:hypothetical protein
MLRSAGPGECEHEDAVIHVEQITPGVRLRHILTCALCGQIVRTVAGGLVPVVRGTMDGLCVDCALRMDRERGRR